MKVNALLFVETCEATSRPTRFKVVVLVDPLVLIASDSEERLLTFFCQAQAEHGDQGIESLAFACSGPEGASPPRKIDVVNEDQHTRMIWTNEIKIRMRLVPGEYLFAIGQPGRVDATCWVIVAKSTASNN